jgi:radical SAM superfamily enzyme YgiQ (UPF0313 family)
VRLALLNIESERPECINKDFMGGYGWAFNAGDSFPARLINFVKKRGENIPLLSFGYLAAIFDKYGHSVEYLTNQIPEAGLVIISSSMVDYQNEILWARKIRSKGRKVGFIGPFSGFKPELFLDSCDFIIKGEPEEAIINIARSSIIPGGIVESKAVNSLEDLPFPKWDIFPVSDYSYYPALKERPFLPILASRGCAYKCNYCPYIVSYKYRSRGAESVLNEIKYLKDKFGLSGMIFRDPLFGINREFVVSLCEKLLHNKLNIRWVCETRLNLLDKDLLKLMYRAGLRVLNTGIESADPTVLKKSTRVPVALKHQEDMVKYCDKLGIRVTAFYIIGLPDDTKEGVLRTIKYAKHLNTHVAQFFVHTPFPGTERFDMVKARFVDREWQ